MSTILFTGGSGLLALNWAAWARGTHDVILCRHERQVRLEGARTARADLASVDGFSALLSEFRPTLVVHAAGLTSVEDCEARPELARQVNAIAAGNVAAACAARGVALAHISTDHLFTGERPSVREDEPVEPLNVYGKTKAEAERLVLAAQPAALVVRTNFFGWGTAYRKSFSDFIIGNLRAGRPISLWDDVHFTPLLIESLARAVHGLHEAGAHGVFNVVGSERVSKYEFGRRLAERFGLDAGLIRKASIGENAGLTRRPRDMSLSNAKAQGVLAGAIGPLHADFDALREQERRGLNNELGQL